MESGINNKEESVDGNFSIAIKINAHKTRELDCNHYKHEYYKQYWNHNDHKTLKRSSSSSTKKRTIKITIKRNKTEIQKREKFGWTQLINKTVKRSPVAVKSVPRVDGVEGG